MKDNITEDLELWNNWKKSPNRTNLQPLLARFNTDIQKRVNMFTGAELPKPAMVREAKKFAIDAFETYDPKKGASLNTHVYQHLKRLNRYVGDLQNEARIPENRRFKITQFRSVKNELTETLLREPTIAEIADKLIWPMEEVERMEAELRGKTLTSVFEGDMITGEGLRAEHRIVRNIYYELSPQEQLVFEYLLGMGGKPKLNESQIAKKTGMSVSKISRIKNTIGNKIESYM